MSVSNDPNIEVHFLYKNCGLDNCNFIYSSYFDIETGKVTYARNSLDYHMSEWVKLFEGEYDGKFDNKGYSIFRIEHATDGTKLNLRSLQPYLNFDVIVTNAEYNIVEGVIKEISSDGEEEEQRSMYDSMKGRSFNFKLKDDQTIEIEIDGQTYRELKRSTRR